MIRDLTKKDRGTDDLPELPRLSDRGPRFGDVGWT
jgi:hypothetical protein